jgi:aromatic-L-amino-acid decarboxylase
MDADNFRRAAHSAIEEGSELSFFEPKSLVDSSAVIEYYETVENRRVLSDVTPGYLQKILPVTAPEEGEAWSEIQKDIESKIMPGLTHWYDGRGTREPAVGLD